MRLSLLLLPIMLLCQYAISQPLLTDSYLDHIPRRSQRLAGYSRESAECYLTHGPLHRVEGIWMFTASGATVTMERFTPDDAAAPPVCYRLVVLSAPSRSIVPGTIMGYAVPTSRQGVYDAALYTSSEDASLTTPGRFTIKMGDDDNRLSFTPVKRGVTVNIRRYLPYMFRIGISRYDTRDASLDGCVRVYPSIPGIEPRYL
ncbi:MAG: hypothetical protein NC117_10205 [Pseudoflavonifractor sp.]|nr:hypothetical protein [Pseudoflavonifractor sp.]